MRNAKKVCKLVTAFALSLSLVGCGGQEGTWQVPKKWLSQSEDKATQTTTDVYFDLSKSVSDSDEINDIYSGITSILNGTDSNYYSLQNQNIEKIDPGVINSGNYTPGAAPYDYLNLWSPDPDHITVVTTDLQSDTTTAEDFGKWLADTECETYSFYVFKVPFSGSIVFNESSLGSSQKSSVTVSNCNFENKRFLITVMGPQDSMASFNKEYREELEEEETDYDVFSLTRSEKQSNSTLLELTSAPCFDDDYEEIKFDNTNFCFGLEENYTVVEDGEEIEYEKSDFNMPNTFIYKANDLSYSENPDGVRIVLYSETKNLYPNIVKDKTVTSVTTWEEDEDAEEYTGSWKKSKTRFKVETESLDNGLLASDFIPDKEKDELDINEELGGAIVQDGNVFKVVISNENIKKNDNKIYAIDIELTPETEVLKNFISNNSATGNEYHKALKTDCEEESSGYYNLKDGTTDSVYEKLNGLDSVISTLSKQANPDECIRIRIILDLEE